MNLQHEEVLFTVAPVQCAELVADGLRKRHRSPDYRFEVVAGGRLDDGTPDPRDPAEVVVQTNFPVQPSVLNILRGFLRWK